MNQFIQVSNGTAAIAILIIILFYGSIILNDLFELIKYKTKNKNKIISIVGSKEKKLFTIANKTITNIKQKPRRFYSVKYYQLYYL